MRKKRTEWEKFEDRLEAGRVDLRPLLGLPPYVPHGQRGKPGYAQTPKFKATSKRVNRTGRKDGEL